MWQQQPPDLPGKLDHADDSFPPFPLALWQGFAQGTTLVVMPLLLMKHAIPIKLHGISFLEENGVLDYFP